MKIQLEFVYIMQLPSFVNQKAMCPVASYTVEITNQRDSGYPPMF